MIRKFFLNSEEISFKIGINLILRLLGILLGYFNILIISRLYGVSSYGIFTICFTIISIAKLIPVFGMETSIVRLYSQIKEINYKETGQLVFKVLSITFFLGLVFTFCLFLLSTYIGNVLNKPYLINDIKKLSLIVIPLSLVNLISGIFQALNIPKTHMFLKAIILQLLLLAFLLLNKVLNFNFDIISIFVISVFFACIISLYLLWFRLKKEKFNYITNSSIITYINILKISYPMLLASSIFLIMGWTDILMLGYFVNDNEVGVFNACLKLSTLIGISLVAVNSIVVQKFAYFYVSKKYIDLKKLVKKSTKVIFYLSFPISLLFILAPEFLLGVIGNEYKIGANVLIVLTIGKFINASCGSVGFLMQMTNQEKLHQKILLIACINNVLFNYLLIPSYGIMGAAIANTFSLILWNFLMVFAIKKKLGFWTLYLPFLK